MGASHRAPIDIELCTIPAQKYTHSPQPRPSAGTVKAHRAAMKEQRYVPRLPDSLLHDGWWLDTTNRDHLPLSPGSAAASGRAQVARKEALILQFPSREEATYAD